MTQLQINSPEMKDIFETRFNSNQEKFMEFIVSFIQDNKNIVDNYFDKKKKSTIKYKKLDPITLKTTPKPYLPSILQMSPLYILTSP